MTARAPGPRGSLRHPGPRPALPVARVVLLGTVALACARSSSSSACRPTRPCFVASAASILGLAWVVGASTERLGSLTGPQVGGILNATFGNIAELIIAFFALQAGLIEVVKASLTGSTIGNLLLVTGRGVLPGGLRHGTQSFSPRIAASNAALLVARGHRPLRPGGLRLHDGRPDRHLTEESVLVAVVLIVGYVLSLVYQFTHPAATLGGHGEPAGHAGPAWSMRRRRSGCSWAAALLAVLSEILVGCDRAVHRDDRAVRVLRRGRGHPDDRQPRRASRRGPARR